MDLHRAATRLLPLALLGLASASAALAADVKDPGYDAALREAKKSIRSLPEKVRQPMAKEGQNFLDQHQKADRYTEAQKDIQARVAALDALAALKDTRVFEEMTKFLPGLNKEVERTRVELDESTEKYEKVRLPYFEAREEEFRRTGAWPTTILVNLGKTLDTLEWDQTECAIAYDRALRLRDAATAGLGVNLASLGEARDLVWKAAVKFGLESKDPWDRVAFCEATKAMAGKEADAILLQMEAKDSDPNVVAAAIGALAARRSEAGFPKIVARVASPDDRIAIAAIKGITGYRSPDTIPTLVARLKSAEGRILEDIVEALFGLTGKHLPDAHSAWEGWWKENGRTFLRRWDADVQVRKDEIEAIGLTDGRLIDVPAELAALLPTESDQGCRDAILENLSIHKSDFARRTLIASLADPALPTRIAAIRGLAQYRHISVPEELIRRVPLAGKEELQAIYQTLRLLWTAEEFACRAAEREPLLQWWTSVNSRVAEQFQKLGERAKDIASGKQQEGELDAQWRDRNFYGLRILSNRVLFVVDVSLSMEEPAQKGSALADEVASKRTKLEVAKSEMTRVIRTLPDDTLFGMVFFSVTEQVWDDGMVLMNSANRKKALKWVEDLKPKEATNIYDALETAFEIGTPKSPVRAAGAPDTIYFLSDGAPTAGKYLKPDIIREHVRRWNKTRGVKLHVVGVGADHDILFCRSLAEENGGYYVAR